MVTVAPCRGDLSPADVTGILVGLTVIFIDQDVRNLDKRNRYAFAALDAKASTLRSGILKTLVVAYLYYKGYDPLLPRHCLKSTDQVQLDVETADFQAWAEKARITYKPVSLPLQ